MAIAYGSSTNSGVIGGTNTITFAAPSVSGSNLIGWVSTFARDSGSEADTDVSTVTWNGVSMTKAVEQNFPFSAYLGASLWYIVAPTDGNVVVTWGGSIDTGAAVAAYFTGASQTGIPDASNGAQAGAGAGLDSSVTITTVADNSWAVSSVYNKTGSDMTASETQIAQLGPNGGGDRAGMSYIGPKTPAGSLSMTWVTSPDDDWAMVVASFAPAAAASTRTMYTRMMQGLGN